MGQPVSRSEIQTNLLAVSAYEAAELATSIRRELVNHGESFIFETVLPDPVGDQVEQLSPADSGYQE